MSIQLSSSSTPSELMSGEAWAKMDFRPNTRRDGHVETALQTLTKSITFIATHIADTFQLRQKKSFSSSKQAS